MPPYDTLFSVADQTVFVVGASRGIGRAIAAGFASRSARVVIAGRDESTITATATELSVGARHEVEGVVCDTAERARVIEVVDDLVERHGGIDTLVQVAGVNRRKPTLEITAEDYETVVGINLDGAFTMAQAVGRHMVRRGSGNQIHVTSLNAIRPLLNVVPYAMSKAGLERMVQALALEWGPHGVRVNGIAPGFILTDLTEKLWSDPNMQSWGRTNTPQGRLGRPEDMVGAAIFLASQASAFMTGQSVVVDGGFTAGWSWPIPPG